MLNCLLVLLVWYLSDPEDKFSFQLYALIVNNLTVFCICIAYLTADRPDMTVMVDWA